ncbi:MAG: FAD binding domain-containing protein [Acidobacteria bacterium]|nr:FAD binding domain-containing protein [Acidobacteriota bacterium]
MAAYFRPETLAEAVQVLAQTGGTPLAGGTDVFPSLQGSPLVGTLVDLSRVSELSGIEVTSEAIHIGGHTTWSKIATGLSGRGFDGLRSAARQLGSVQTQNCATIAGNLCNASPAADGIPCLLALEAEVSLVSTAGVRRIPLDDFIVGNRRTLRRADEILSVITISRRWEEAGSSFLKLGARRYLVISIAMVAAVVRVEEKQIQEARLAVGSCSARALRLRELENELRGQRLRPGLSAVAREEHLSSLSPIGDVRGTAEYRRSSALVLVRRSLEAALETIDR